MEFQHLQMTLFSQESNMLGNGLFSTGFGTFGCYDGRTPSDEHGQNGAEGTTDRYDKKGVVQPHCHDIWRNTPFQREQIVTCIQSTTCGEANRMTILERSVDIVSVVHGLLCQIGCQNADADCTKDLAGDAHQRGGFGYGSLVDHGEGQGLQRSTHTTQAPTTNNQPELQALSTRMHIQVGKAIGPHYQQDQASDSKHAGSNRVVEPASDSDAHS